MNYTDVFVNGLYDMARAPLPHAVAEKVRLCVLDYVAVTVAGANEAREKLLAVCSTLLGSPGESTLIGLGRRVSITTAALINGTAAHTLELDDGHRVGMVHTGAVIITAALLAAQMAPGSEKRLASAIVCGYEAALAIAKSVQPSHKKRFFHATGTCGAVGAAAAAAVVLNFSRDQLKGAVSAAATSASGLLETVGSDLKSFNAGNAAANGLVSALWAQAGLSVPDDMIGGDRGFWGAFCDKPTPEALVWDHKHYCINEIYLKTYAACRYAHPVIEAAIHLRSAHDFDLASISAIVVSTYDLALEGHCQKDIPNPQVAMASIPFGLATALVNGKATEAEFSGGNIDDPQITRLVQLTEVREDPEFSALVPGKRPALLTLTLKDGQTLSYRVDFPKGEPENPVTTAELRDKFDHLLAAGGMEGKAQAIYEQVMKLDDVQALMNLIQ